MLINISSTMKRTTNRTTGEIFGDVPVAAVLSMLSFPDFSGLFEALPMGII